MSPEPSDDEREAILAALARAGGEPPVGEESPWRRAALQEGVEGLDP